MAFLLLLQARMHGFEFFLVRILKLKFLRHSRTLLREILSFHPFLSHNCHSPCFPWFHSFHCFFYVLSKIISSSFLLKWLIETKCVAGESSNSHGSNISPVQLEESWGNEWHSKLADNYMDRLHLKYHIPFFCAFVGPSIWWGTGAHPNWMGQGVPSGEYLKGGS